MKEHESFPTRPSRAYIDVAAVIGRALEVLSVEDEWLRGHRTTLDEKIERGLAQLERGGGIPDDAARARLQERRNAFFAKNPRDHAVSAFTLSPETEEDVWRIWSYLAPESGIQLAGRAESALLAAL